MAVIRTARAGSAIEDYCRACKVDRMHTVMAADIEGQPLRVQCGYCRSEHNYRGGPRTAEAEPARRDTPDPARRAAAERARRAAAESAGRAAAERARPPSSGAAGPMPIVSDRERTGPPIMLPQNSEIDLESLLRRVIREEAGVTGVPPAEKWRGGTLVLRPATPGLQEKSIPIETFFHKIVMLRNRLRTLEQHVNASDLPEDVKLKLQAYVSGCYGSLTTFNVLFADEDDQFKGAGGD